MSEFVCPKCGAVLIVSAKAEQPKRALTVEDAKTLFPPELEQLLTFQENQDHIILKTKKFLASGDFAKIGAIVRANKGEYISAGKDSHFKIPRKQ